MGPVFPYVAGVFGGGGRFPLRHGGFRGVPDFPYAVGVLGMSTPPGVVLGAGGRCCKGLLGHLGTGNGVTPRRWRYPMDDRVHIMIDIELGMG